jgi:hypothetical protein
MKLQHLYNWKIYFILLFTFLQLNFENKVLAQAEHTGIIWVVPNRPDAFPVNGNRTGNSGLNLAFEDYHVMEYSFLDSIYITGLLYKQPIYQIRLDEQFTDSEYEFVNVLHYCYPGFYTNFTLPYYNPFIGEQQTLTTDNGLITLMFYDDYFDYSLLPKSNTRSYNKHMNLILINYDIKSYFYTPYFVNSGDTLLRTIEIVCQYQDLLPLYYDLLSISHLYDAIGASGFMSFGESSSPCGSYSGISSEVEKSIYVFPNPAIDEIFISGVIPKSIIVYDVMGNRVITEFDVESNKIDIKNLPNGFYIIEILSVKGDVLTSKFIK